MSFQQYKAKLRQEREELANAMLECKHLRITYVDKDSVKSVREITPHTAEEGYRGWLLRAHCHLRKEPRTFRVDRVLDWQAIKDPAKPSRYVRLCRWVARKRSALKALWRA